MACIRKRRGKYVVDYRDSTGRRRWITCETKRDADEVLSAKIRENRQLTRPAADADVTVAQCAARWIATIASSLKPRTVESYQQCLRLYIEPRFGTTKIRKLHRGLIKEFLAQHLSSGLAPNTVRIIHATLRAMLNEAVEDGILMANPAVRLGKKLRLVATSKQRQEQIKAMDREQLFAFLGATANSKNGTDRTYYPLFLLMARTGLRLGEAIALELGDLDFERSTIRVERAFSAGRIETPKTGEGRDVDMSRQLAATLRQMIAERRHDWFKEGKGQMPSLLFISEAGTMLDGANIRKVFARSLKTAKLPPHFTPHCLRHTFASLLLQQGASPAYVQRQLGHASIKLTVDTYGKWLPMGNRAEVDRLDDQNGSKAVADEDSESQDTTVSH